MSTARVISMLWGLALLVPAPLLAWTLDTAVNTPVVTDPADQSGPVMVTDGSGGAIIAWGDERNGEDNDDIYAQRLDATGAAQWTADGVGVCTAPGRQGGEVMVADGAGGAILVWKDRSNAAGDQLVAQRVDGNGVMQWSADGVAVVSSATDPGLHRIISDGTGGFIVAWLDTRSGGASGIYAQRVNADGVVQWAADGVPVPTAVVFSGMFQIATDSAGGIVVVWAERRDSVYNVFAQRLDVDGVAQWGGGGVSVSTDAGTEYYPHLTADGAGGSIVVWSRLVDMDFDVYAQRLDSSGVGQWPTGGVAVTAAPSSQYEAVAVPDGSGGAVIVWRDYRPGGDANYEYSLYAQRVDGSGAAQWAADGEFVTVSFAESSNTPLAIVGDGAGGVIVAVAAYDAGLMAGDIYAQRVSGDGSLPWGSVGVTLSSASEAQYRPALVTDGVGGAIAAWTDDRNGDESDIYAQNVSADGAASGLEAPVNESPADDAVTDATPDLAASELVDGSGLLSHAASQWRVHDRGTVTPGEPAEEVNADDGVFVYELPFPFPFYGRIITSLSANTNGLVELLEDGETAVEGSDYGTHDDNVHVGQMDAIFAANDDLTMSGGYLRALYDGDQVILEWYGSTYADDDLAGSPLNFQVVLRPDGSIRWDFKQMEFRQFDHDLFSGVYPNGGSEVVVGFEVRANNSYAFDPASGTASAVAYAWTEPRSAVLYDSGETAADLTGHDVPLTAGLADGTTYHWGVRYRADNGQWSPWSIPTALTVAVPAITVSDPVGDADDQALPFSGVAVGGTVAYDVTVNNTGSGALVLGTLALADPLASPFALAADDCTGATLATGASCSFTLQFQPGATGAFDDTFDIPSNDAAAGAVTFTVSGSGVAAAAPDIVVTDSAGSADDQVLVFGEVRAGNSAEHTVTVGNAGNASLTVGAVAAADPVAVPYSIVEDSCSGATLAAGSSCTVRVRFAPAATGNFQDSLDIPSGDPDRPSVSVVLGGVGTAAPDIDVSDNSGAPTDLQVEFGAVERYVISDPAVVTVGNTGGADLVLEQITLENNQSVFWVNATFDGCSGQTLAPGAECTFNVQLVASATDPAGAVTDRVRIPSDDPDENPVEVILTGTVIEPVPVVAPQVALVTPQPGSDRVWVGVGMVTATFSKAMDLTSFDTASFSLLGPSGPVAAAAGTPEYDAAAFTAIFRPEEPLAYGTSYTATLTTAIADAERNALPAAYTWSFTTRPEPVEEGCEPELGMEDGCDNFEGFTYGTGAITPSCSPSSCTGLLGVAAARRSVSQGRDNYEAPPLSQEQQELATIDASATADGSEFALAVRSRDRSESDEDSAGNVYAASRIDVAGVTPGSLVPLALLIDPDTTGLGASGAAALEVSVYDFNYRLLARVYAVESGAHNQLTFFHLPDPADADALQRTDRNVSGLPGEIRLEFLYPADPGNGVFVELRAGAFRGDANLGDVILDVSARLETEVPAGVTVRLASGLTFIGAADSDGDGVADAEDISPADASLATLSSRTGSGVIQVDAGATPGATLGQLRATDADDLLLNQDGRPGDQEFPDGLVSFRLNGLQPGATIDVTLDFPTAFPAGATYYKVDEDGFHPFSGARFSGNQVTLTLTDGGAGDGDRIANGVIIDPGGVAVPEASVGGGGGGGGGCFLQTLGNNPFDR